MTDYLNNIPDKKLELAFLQIRKSCKDCQVDPKTRHCGRCNTLSEATRRYKKANVPVRYWNLEMDEFQGDEVLKKLYEDLAKDKEALEKAYTEGVCIALGGTHGIGKTMAATNIIKKALQVGYSGLYTNLSDIVAYLVNGKSEDKAHFRSEVIKTDFLIIDEFDGRWFSANGSDMFGRILEEVIRSRFQNKLPTILITNSTKILDTFSGPIQKSLESLFNYTKEITVLGSDMRKKGK